MRGNFSTQISTQILLLFLSRLRVARDIHRLACRLHGGKTAIVAVDGVLTYRQLLDRVSRYVSAFEELGLRKGDGVFTLLRDGVDQLAVQFAACDAGLVRTAFHLRHDIDHVREAADRAKPKLFIHDPSRADVPGLDIPGCAYWSAPGADKADSKLEARLKRQVGRLSRAEVSPIDPMAAGYTSGTTGKPKTIMTRQDMPVRGVKVLLKTIAAARTARTTRAGVTFAAAPWVGAGSTVIAPTLLTGGALVVMDEYNATGMCALIEKHKVSRLFVTPSQLIDLIEAANTGQYDLSSLTNIIYGSAPAPAQKVEEALGLFGPILQQGYGMSEVSPVSMLQPADHFVDGKPAPRFVLSCSGKIAPNVEVKILDHDGSTLGAGKIGAIWVKSAAVFEGYADRPDLNEKIFAGGFYRSGDFGFLDDEGRLHVLDREYDIIQCRGAPIYPRQVEEHVHDLPEIKEAAMVEVAGRVILCVSLRQAHKNAPAETVEAALRALLQQRLDSRFLPDDIEILPELPRSFLNKVLRREIRAFLAADIDRRHRLKPAS